MNRGRVFEEGCLYWKLELATLKHAKVRPSLPLSSSGNVKSHAGWNFDHLLFHTESDKQPVLPFTTLKCSSAAVPKLRSKGE